MAQKPLKRMSDSGDGQEMEQEQELHHHRAIIKKVKLEHGAELEASQQAFHEDEASHSDDEEDLHESSSQDSQNTDFQEDEDPNFGDDSEIMRAYEAAKQRGRGNRLSSQAGYLKKITLIDFMCHSHLSLKFFKRMNFLVGHNGSGKSAILTGVAVALGSKAATTGRGAGLKDLIKRGCEKATIILTIANAGIMAYRPEVYNPDIVIERTIDRSGGSSYKFRATREGRIISTKRDELTQICARFSINVDSPLTILTQDTAKTFLTSTDEKQLYDFFLRGTSLHDLTVQYESSENSLQFIKRALARADSSLTDLRNDSVRYGRQVEEARAAGDMIKKRDSLDKELAWAFVQGKEKQLAILEQSVDDLKAKLVMCEKQLGETEERQKDIARDIEDLDRGLKEYEADKVPLEQERKRLMARRKEAEQRRNEARAILADCDEAIAAKKRDIEIVLKQLNENSEFTDRHRILKEKREAYDKHQILLNKMQREKSTKEKEYDAVKNKIDLERREAQRIRIDLDESRKRVENVQLRLNNLQIQSKNRITAFGQSIDIVLRAISNAKWRHSPPIGPLGQFVQLKDMRYKNTVQSLLGGLLCGFAVRDKYDKDQLTRILIDAQRRGYQAGHGQRGTLPPIIQHSGDMFDFSKGDLSHLGETVLSKLNVTNDHVLRILINAAHIEGVFVAPNQQIAEAEIKRLLATGLKKVTVYSEGPEKPYTQTGESGGARVRESGPLNHWRGNTLFYNDIAAEIAQQTSAVEIATGERREQERRVTEQDAKQRRSRSELEKIMAVRDRVDRAIMDTERKLNSLNEEIIDLRPEDSNALEQTRNEYQAEVTRFEEERIQLQADVDQKGKELVEIRQAITLIEQRLEEFIPEREQRKKALNLRVQALVEAGEGERHIKRSRDRYRAEIQSRQAGIDETRKDLEKYIRNAMSISNERIESTRKTEVIQRERAAADNAIAESVRRGQPDIHEATRKYLMVKDKLDKTEKFCKEWERLAADIQVALAQRQQKWFLLRSHISIRAKAAFITNILRRNMEGRLVYEHKENQLKIQKG